ncbi:ribosome maturation protein, partial [Chaetomium strumarium]
MARGGSHMTRVHYKGQHDDYFVFLDSLEDYRRWLKDSSIPLAQVVRTFQIFCTHKHGNQGMYDHASNADLDNEFGTHVDVEVLEKVLRAGTVTEGHMVERNGFRNDANGGW